MCSKLSIYQNLVIIKKTDTNRLVEWENDEENLKNRIYSYYFKFIL